MSPSKPDWLYRVPPRDRKRPPRSPIPNIPPPRDPHHVPVSRVPAELALRIFGYLVETESLPEENSDDDPMEDDYFTVVYPTSPWELSRSRRGSLWQAAWTCRAWHELILTTPNLWTVIDVDQSCLTLQIGLELSGNHPVDIRFHHPAAVPIAMQLLWQNTHRIKSLIVMKLDVNTLPSLAPLWRVPMPALEELWVNTEGHGGFEDDLAPPLEAELVPNLQAVHFSDLPFSWDWPLFQRLRALSLCMDPHISMVNVEDILRPLTSCHNLEFLKLDGAFRLNSCREDTEWTVSLPQLKSVYLASEQEYDISEILCHVQFNPAVELDLHIRIEEPFKSHDMNRKTGVGCIVTCDSSCIPLLRTATRAQLSDLDFECWGPAGCGRLAVTFDQINIEGWEYFIETHTYECGNLLREAPLEELTIQQGWTQNLPLDTWDLGDFLRNFPRLVSFEYEGLQGPGNPCTTCTDLLAVLNPFTSPEDISPPEGLTDNHTQPMVPQLSRLVIVLTEWSHRYLTALRDCLRARASIGLFLDRLYIGLQNPEEAEQRALFEQDYALVAEDLRGLVRDEVGIRHKV